MRQSISGHSLVEYVLPLGLFFISALFIGSVSGMELAVLRSAHSGDGAGTLQVAAVEGAVRIDPAAMFAHMERPPAFVQAACQRGACKG